MNKEISKAISLLRFPLLVMVIFIHIPRISDGPAYYMFISRFFSCAISGIAVPMFFAISGYLFFVKTFTWTEYFVKLRKRVSSLLIPFLLWNFIAFIFLIVRCFDIYELTFWNVLVSFWSTRYSFIHAGYNPINFPLWYVRDLMVCVLCAPIYFYAIKYFKVLMPVVFVSLWIFNIQTPITGFSTISIAFFSLGAYMAIHHKDAINEKKGKWNFIGTILFVVLCFFQSIYIGLNEIFAYLIALLGIVCIPSTACLFVDKYFHSAELMSRFAGCTFFIYAAHGIIFKPIYNILERFDSIPEIIIYFTTFGFTLCFCYVGWRFVDKYMPRLSKLLNGR